MADKKKNILILGGAGFLGANLVRRVLREPGVKVTVVDSLEPLFKSSKASLDFVADKIDFIQGDIRDQKFLRQVIPGHDIIFNCAAQSSHPLSVKKPVLDAEINCIGTLRVLEAVRDYNPQAVLVYTSSSTVIGKAANEIVDETHGERPLEIYSANKSAAEKYHRIFTTVYDLKTVVLRFTNLYGPLGKADPAFGFVNYFISRATSDQPITVYGDGQQSRNLMFVDDATEVLWQAAHQPKLFGETYFAAHHEHHTVREVAELIVKTFGRGSIEYVPWPDFRKRIEIDKVKISSQKLHDLIGWEAKYSLKEGLELTRARADGKF